MWGRWEEAYEIVSRQEAVKCSGVNEVINKTWSGTTEFATESKQEIQ